METLRSFNERLEILIEENPHSSSADLKEAAESAPLPPSLPFTHPPITPFPSSINFALSQRAQCGRAWPTGDNGAGDRTAVAGQRLDSPDRRGLGLSPGWHRIPDPWGPAGGGV